MVPTSVSHVGLLRGSQSYGIGVGSGRALGLVERFQLFRNDYGWKIQPLTPEGWLGMVASVEFAGWNPWLRWILSSAALLLLALALVRGAKTRPRQIFLVLCFTLPVLAGYILLVGVGAVRSNNATYDAYKLLAAFYPALLGGFFYWLTLANSESPGVRRTAMAFAIIVVAFNGYAGGCFLARMRPPPLMVDRPLLDIRRVEAMDRVHSINILTLDAWSGLWANVFLLRKPQYFVQTDYEGRVPTALKGEWDLLGPVLSVHRPDHGADIQLKPPFTLVSTRSPNFVRASLGAGWHNAERPSHSKIGWCWAKGTAIIEIENPQEHVIAAAINLSMRSLVEGDLQIWARGEELGSFRIDTKTRPLPRFSVTLPPGTTSLELRSTVPPVSDTSGRQLSFAAYNIDIEVQPDSALTSEGPDAPIASSGSF